MPENRNNALQVRYGDAYKWLAVSAVILGLLTTIFSSTMVNVALTDIMETFQITQGSAQWMSTAFLCTTSVGMLTTAWLMRAIGPRQTFLLAIFIFLIGSLAGWLAPTYEILIIARLFQGAGAGIIQPLSMALVFILFPAEIRGRAMGLFGMGVVLGPALGPIVGGIITDSVGWHTTFAVVLPLAFIAGILGWIFLPDRQANEKAGQFNLISFFLIALTVGSLLTGLSNSQFHDLFSPMVIPYLSIAGLGLILFVLRELKSAAPLVQLKMFKNLVLTSSAIIGILVSAGMFSSIYIIPLFVRTVQLKDATAAGLILLPAGLALAITFPIVGRLIDRMPAYRLILFGLVFFICSSFALSYSDKDSSFMILAGWIILGRISLGFVMPTNSTMALTLVVPEQVPQASGALNFVRMLGGTIGVNLTALLITARSNFHLQDALNKSSLSVLSEAEKVQAMTNTFQDSFLITCIVFSFSIVPGLYITWATLKGRV